MPRFDASKLLCALLLLDGLNSLLVFVNNHQSHLPPFIDTGLGQQQGMLAELLDITQDKEGILNLPVLNQIL